MGVAYSLGGDLSVIRHVSMARRRVIAVLCVVTGLALYFSGDILRSHYITSRPTEVDIAAGRTHELNNHGYVVYLTVQEWTTVNGLLIVGIVSAFAGILVGLGTRERNRQ